jgi:hypothetical protein
MEDPPLQDINCRESVQTTTTCKTDPKTGELLCDRVRKKIRQCPGQQPQIEVVKEEGVKGSNVLTTDFDVTVDFSPLRSIFRDIFRGRSVWDEWEEDQGTSPEFVKKHLKHDPQYNAEISAPVSFNEDHKSPENLQIKNEGDTEDDDYWVYDPRRTASHRNVFSAKSYFDRLFEEMLRDIFGNSK